MVHSITLQTYDGTITDNDILGQICFAAPNEAAFAAGAVTASIFARSETAFDDTDKNETELVFATASGGATGARPATGLAGDMTLSSAGLLTIAGGINVSGGTIAGTLATAAQGNVTSLGTLTALTVDDVAINGKVVTMTGSTDDTVVFTVGTHGTLSIVTTDTADAAANIQITADGTVDIDSAGVLTLDSGAAINIEPASGSAILLDGTISIDAGVVTGATSITSTAFVGDITGDVTGNADTATALATARTINGTSFNGTANITITAAGSTLSDTVTVAKGGTGATSLTDGGILLGSGTGAITAMSVLGDGVIVVGDNSTDPTTITAFTASDGVLKHEVGGLELNISAIAIGDVLAGTGTGAVGIVTSTGHADGQVLTLQADGTADWEAASGGGSGDVSAGTDFSTDGIIMAANGTSKTIDVPGTTLTTNGYAMTVSAAESTPFTANGGAGTTNNTFVFQSGTGDTNNNAIIKLISGTAASSYLYMGDASDPDRGHIRYNNDTDSMLFKVNAATVMTIAAEGDVTFSKAIKPAAPAAASGTSGTVTLDCDTTNHFTITSSSNITGLNFTNASVGQRIIVRVTNGGSDTIAFGSDTIKWPGGTAPTLTTGGGIDVYGFLCITSSSAFDGFIIGQALA